MSTETELKLAIDSITIEKLQNLPEIINHAVAPAHKRQLDNIYFDTARLDLYKNDVALRLRRDGDRWLQTIKTSGRAAAGLHQRSEWETAVDGTTLQLDRFEQPQIRRLLGKPGLRKALIPIFRTDFQRVSWELEYPHGSLIEISLDVGHIQAGERTEAISELEIELIKGTAQDLIKTGRALAEPLPVRLFDLSKAERGYRLAAYRSAVATGKADPLRLRHKTSAEQAFIAILRQGISRLQANESLLLAHPRDIDSVRQMRLATRYIQSCLKLYRPLIPRTLSAVISNGIQRVADALEPAHDWDVFIEATLQPLEAEFPMHTPLQTLVRAARDEREIVYLRTVNAIQTRDYTLFLLDLNLWLEQRAWRKALKRRRLAALDQTARHFARRVLKRYHTKLTRLGQQFGTLDAMQRHQLLIRCRRLRYAAEFFAELYDDERTRVYISSLAVIQDVLGALNGGRRVEHLIAQLPAACQTESAADLVRVWTAATVRAHLKQFDSAWETFTARSQFWN